VTPVAGTVVDVYLGLGSRYSYHIDQDDQGA